MSTRKIVLAGGCFWGVEEYYRRLKGVVGTRVGYAQGFRIDPVYTDVKKQLTGHAEVVEVEYDPSLISLPLIFNHLFRMIDPTSFHKQGGDIGSQYRTGIYTNTNEDLQVAQQFIREQQTLYSKPIMVEVEQLKKFYDAEDYHQEYLVKNPEGYCHVDFSKIKPEELK
jgi:methionine-S-sulfoxide reductase